MKTILIPIHDGTITKNLLRTDFLKHLQSAPEVRIVLLLNHADADAYRTEFGSPTVVVEDSRVYKRADKIELIFSTIFRHSIPTRFMQIRQVDWYWNKKKYFLYTMSSTLRILGHFRWWRKVLVFVNTLEPIDPKVRTIYQKWNPDLVFAPTMLSRVEVALMRLGRKNRVPVVGMAKSFDNLTSKAYLRVHPDSLIVPNQTGVTEATTLYNYPKEKIHVTGIPQYDVYVNPHLIIDRVEFLENIGLEASKKTILYAPAGDWMNPNDHEVLAQILEWTTNGILPNTQVLLRLHPTYESRTQELDGHPNLHVERPGTHHGNLKWYEFGAGDVQHLANSLAHSDVVINTGSTLMVESCIFNTPVITLGFDGQTKKNYWQSVIRYYDREHLLPVIKTGGVPVAKSFQELQTLITTYYKNPQLHTEERKKAAFAVCGSIDGMAGKRTATVVLQALQKAT
jgi:CDP-glycerol glycerophosphotransferase (TagB/SpsB family)